MFFFFFFNDTATTEIYPLSLPDALPIYPLDMTKHAQSPRKTSAATPRQAGVGLALGGGFARGFAHLGVLQVFEENNVPISHIAGTSVGSILGAAYASGAPLVRIIETCRTLRFPDIARWRVSRLGLAGNHPR